METLLQDLRYAMRTLRRAPGFTVAAVATLALGIGANTAIFSVVESVLLRPLPYPHADQLVAIWARRGTEKRLLTAIADVEDYRARSRSFQDVGVIRQQSVNLTGTAAPDRVVGAYVSANALTVLGARASRGRLFSPEETAQGTAADVAVLSYDAWATRFGGDSTIVGRTLNLDGRPRVVIGVTEKGFRDPMTAVDVWLPVGRAPSPGWFARGAFNVWAYGRLKRGVTVAEAQRDLSAIAAELATANPASNAGMDALVLPMREQVVGPTQALLLTVLGFVGVVLLIACANVANLQLARAEGRRREIAVRAALGARQSRLVQQLLAESLVLSIAGGIAGVLLASWATQVLVGAVPGGVPAFGKTGLNNTVLAFSLLLTLLTGFAFGAAPSWRGARVDLNRALSLRPGQSRGGRGIGARDLLVAVQLALCVVLLIGAGLLSRSLVALQRVDPGFNPENLLTAEYRIPSAKYTTPAAIIQFHEQVLSAVRAIPGVRSAALLRSVPLTGNFGRIGYAVEGAAAVTPAPISQQNSISDQFFSTMGIKLVAGRDFDEHDRADAAPVVIVNEEFARRSWPGQSALGKRITLLGPPDQAATVVGVVANVAQIALGDPPAVQLYQPASQAPGTYNGVAVRTVEDPAQLARAVRSAIWSVDRDQPVWRVRPMAATMGAQVAQPRFTFLLTGAFALLALALATVGVYGVMSYVLVQRTREVGIRMALGAQRNQVVRLALSRGIRVLLIGTAVGLPVALGAARLLRTQLFGVGAADPLTFALVPAVLAAVTLLACYIPARRAARVDPMVALRSE
jgi:putative ABC transport system permease protein